ncbi:hypothetical protein SDC9_193104 [bioreactor metagenome]|uniref:Uncharacterized protein n=1 Tax=bioreactor metagenome TaxID=1076179 RepID=A0A645I2K7_9ZZZZ
MLLIPKIPLAKFQIVKIHGQSGLLHETLQFFTAFMNKAG